jgi:hypothetical protein
MMFGDISPPPCNLYRYVHFFVSYITVISPRLSNEITVKFQQVTTCASYSYETSEP